MSRRCAFLDTLPTFNYNSGRGEPIHDKDDKSNSEDVQEYTDTTELGSTLLCTMLNEVSDFCNPSVQRDWSSRAYQQVRVIFVDYKCHIM